MSDYRLHSWGPNSSVASGSAWTSSTHSLETFAPKSDFWIEVAFDVCLTVDGLPGPSYYFLVCNSQGLANYVRSNFYLDEQDMTLKNVVVVHEYSYQHIINYLQTEVSEKCVQLTNQELFLYLATRFDIEED